MKSSAGPSPDSDNLSTIGELGGGGGGLGAAPGFGSVLFEHDITTKHKPTNMHLNVLDMYCPLCSLLPKPIATVSASDKVDRLPGPVLKSNCRVVKSKSK